MMLLRERATRFNRRYPAFTSAVFCFAMSILGATLIWLTKTGEWGRLESMIAVQITMTSVATTVAQLINGFTPGETVRSVGAASAITLCGIVITWWALR